MKIQVENKYLKLFLKKYMLFKIKYLFKSKKKIYV